MKTKFLHILTSLLLLVIAGCSKGVSVEESQPEDRIVNLSLGITTRADDLSTSDIPDVLYLWIFNENDNNSCLYFTKIDNPQFSGIDIEGNPVETVNVKFLTTNGTKLKFYVVLNNVTDENKFLVQFDKYITLDKLNELQFTLSTYGSDNKVPMSGTADLTIESISNDYMVEIPAERAVAKLELFITKNTPSSNLQITGITLSNNPETGILFKNNAFNPTINEEPATNLIGNNSISITASLSEVDAPGSDDLYLFEGDNSKLQKINFMNPYLLENPWGDEDIHLDNGLIIDSNLRYYITLSYNLNGSNFKKDIYLSEMKRNTLNKVFIRIKEQTLPIDIDLSWKVREWIEKEIDVPSFS